MFAQAWATHTYEVFLRSLHRSGVKTRETRAGVTHAHSGAVVRVAARHGVVQRGDVGDDGLLVGVRDVDI